MTVNGMIDTVVLECWRRRGRVETFRSSAAGRLTTVPYLRADHTSPNIEYLKVP